VTPRARTYDESDVRIRPNRRGSRPRTKDRPAHEDAIPGFVTGVDRGRYTLVVHDGGERVVVAMKARELGRKSVVIGDEVAMVGDTTGGHDSLARIVRVEQRRSVLRRTADDTDPVERIIVANAEQLVIVTALVDPEPRPRMIDRCLVAAYDAGMEPLLVLTKADLIDPTPFLAHYAMLQVRHLVTSRDPATGAWTGLKPLVNALVPGAERATGVVNEVTGRGRHTSSSAVSLRLPGDNGWVVDTPGVRSFGLAHVDLTRIIRHFPDLAPGAEQCPRGCTHDEEECGLDAWVKSGQAGAAGESRLDSFRRLLRARTPHPDD